MKTMRNIVFFITLMSLALPSIAQRTKKVAEKYYEGYSYQEAINRYELLSEKDIKINRELATSYFKINKFEKSMEYWKAVAEDPKATPEDMYNYASVLSINKKYAEAEVWMNKFYEKDKTDRRALMWMKNKGIQNKLQQDKGIFVVKSSDINSKEQDFGTAYFKDNQIAYASSHERPKRLIKRLWNWNKLAFLDVYVANIDSNMNIKDIKRFEAEKVNGKFHDGPVAFNKNGDFMALTRNNYKGKSKEQIVKLQLFTSKLKDNKKWSSLEAFPYNSNDYSVGHATLTANGDTMYFASDMPGGFGGTDIYMTTLNGNTWTTPVNLGETINTEGQEMFPFIQNSKVLYFASDGLPGLGGLDIFKSVVRNNVPGKPENMGVPINSSYDDFALIIDNQDKSGFFSSNRESGQGSDDIYSFKLIAPIEQIKSKYIAGIAYDQSGDILPNVNVTIFDADNDSITTVSTDSEGYYAFEVEPEKDYDLKGVKPNYQDANKSVNTNVPEDTVKADLTLYKVIAGKPNKYIAGVAYDQSGNILSNVNVTLFNADNAPISSVATDSKGKFFFVAEPEKDYDLKGVKADYQDANKAVNTNAPEDTVKADLVLVKSLGQPIINLLVSDYDTNKPLSEVFVDMTDLENNIKNNFTTKGDGTYQFLSSNKINDEIEYKFLLKKLGYENKVYTFSGLLKPSGQNKIHIKMRKEIELPIIYFDFDKSNIRQDASVELNKVVKLMNDYPTMVIELSSHTDCRGSKSYNIALSNRRARSSAQYIRNRLKSNPKRIYGKGYGESQLTNGCECEGAKTSSCSEEEHQLNRRTEFRIIKR